MVNNMTTANNSNPNFDLGLQIDEFEGNEDSVLFGTDDDDGVVSGVIVGETAGLTSETPEIVVIVTDGEKPAKEPKVKADKPAKEPKVPKVKEKSKMDWAREIFNRMYGQEGVERKHIIQAFQLDGNFGELEPLTMAGAGTYYQKLAPKVGSAVPVVLPETPETKGSDEEE